MKKKTVPPRKSPYEKPLKPHTPKPDTQPDPETDRPEEDPDEVIEEPPVEPLRPGSYSPTPAFDAKHALINAYRAVAPDLAHLTAGEKSALLRLIEQDSKAEATYKDPERERIRQQLRDRLK